MLMLQGLQIPKEFEEEETGLSTKLEKFKKTISSMIPIHYSKSGFLEMARSLKNFPNYYSKPIHALSS